MRQLIGVGTPRALQGRLIAIMATLLAVAGSLSKPVTPSGVTNDMLHRLSVGRS